MHVAIALLLIAGHTTPLSEAERAEARAWVAAMKVDRRGPYGGVAWFCNDGTVLPPKSFACVERGGGKQHGVLNPQAEKLGELGIHVGTVLAALEAQTLIDNDYYRSRALVVEYYLERALNGWVLEAARDYRGFRQVEDERESARWLLIELTKLADIIGPNRSLAVRLMRTLPYGRQRSLADEVRALAGMIGDADRAFAKLRYKIHAMPEPTDIAAVDAYCATKEEGDLKTQCLELSGKMRALYDPAARFARLRDVYGWLWNRDCKASLDEFITTGDSDAMASLRSGAAVMAQASALLLPGDSKKQGERNLLLLHVMSLIEELWVGLIAPLSTMPMSRELGLEAVQLLLASAGQLGILSAREVAAATAGITQAKSGEPVAYVAGIAQASRSLEWARARLLADLGLALWRYETVEPRARNVIDDILRSGVMMPLAAMLDRLHADVERLRGGGHRVAGLGEASTAGLRGENAGFATGPLVILAPGGDPKQLARHQIALLQEIPPELPPVAGIITVGAAGGLSHVALLARNLGLPHAAINADIADALIPMAGQVVALGVSTKGRIALGPLSAFPDLKQKKPAARPHTLFLEIKAHTLDLETTRIFPLAEVSPADSGIRVGPKAAELGRLRSLFPDRVSDAAVIPFGAFWRHVNRPAVDAEQTQGAPDPSLTGSGWVRIPPQLLGAEVILPMLPGAEVVQPLLPYEVGFFPGHGGFEPLRPATRAQTRGGPAIRGVPNTHQTFAMGRLRAAYARARGMAPADAEAFLLRELTWFRDQIARLPYVKGFEAEVDAALLRLGKPGSFGVFIRSDTNVEDLPEFTGAGLNKTVANRTQRASILAGIKKVWASPFTERSFRWRQQILKNPEVVFPSVILHRTVPSELSGVLVTTDLEGTASPAITISASEGVAAVVDGGSPETVVIENDGTVRLLASSRSSTRKQIPPVPQEGVVVSASEGHDPLLGAVELEELVNLATEVKKRIPEKNDLPWDIEFGIFKDKAYLLQIRPLRTSTQAATHPFLLALDAKAVLSNAPLDLATALP